MKTAERAKDLPLEEVRGRLASSFRAQMPQIEQSVLKRVQSVSDPATPADPEYVSGMQEAVHDAIEYAIDGIEVGDRPAEPIPAAVSRQAHRAARNGIALDAVLRRCHAGDRALTEWITGAALNLPVACLQEIARTHGLLVDHLTAEMASEYMRELGRLEQSSDQRLRARIQDLLKGNREHDPDLAYDLSGWNLGIIAQGTGVGGTIRDIGRRLGHQILAVPAGEDERLWLWLGGRRRPDPDEIERQLESRLPDLSHVTLGEPHYGSAGWRRTHTEAMTALWVAHHQPGQVTRHRDVILESAVLRDPCVLTSLIEAYLLPLEGRGDTGEILKETLRAYFAAEQNAATTAHILNVDRGTVRRRINKVEKRLGRKLASCAPHLQVALAVEKLQEPARGKTEESARGV